MQGVVFYGRFLARALVNSVRPNLTNDFSQKNSPVSQTKANSLHLVTASAGLSKSHSTAQVITKWSFGDDACFVAGHNKGDVIGVADGVGGWRDYGVDPSQFPKSLMTTCERMVRMGKFTASNPKTILAKSYQEIQENKEMLIGSCTACLVSLHRQESTVYTSNLGDSGFMLVREGKVVQRSEEQQHYFNTPFQLAMVPTVLEGMVLSDMPEAADTTSFDVIPGDIILVGTDGLFDNMKEETILQHLSKLKEPMDLDNIQSVADVIAQHAHQLAFDPDYMSPFAQNAQRNGIFVQGGKPDDITVLLARVSEDPFSES